MLVRSRAACVMEFLRGYKDSINQACISLNEELYPTIFSVDCGGLPAYLCTARQEPVVKYLLIILLSRVWFP